MKIHFVSINTLINIPSVRFIVDFFIQKFNTSVTITERSIVNENNYFDNNKNVIFDKIDESKSFDKFKSQSSLAKVRKYFSVIKKIRKLQKNKTDKIIFITPDFQVIYFTVKLQKFFKHKNFKIIYLQFELVEYQGRLNNFFNKYMLKNADRIDLAVFPEINRLNLFLKSCKRKPLKSFVLPNSCEAINLPKNIKKHQYLKSIPEDAFIVCHVGNVGGTGHFFSQFILAAELLKDENIYFLFIGNQSDTVKKEKEKLHSEKILFFDKIPHQELKQIYPFIDLGLILYKGLSPNFEFAAPNKLYEFWAYGIPVLAHHLKGLIPVFDTKEKGKLINFNISEEIQTELLQILKSDKNYSSELISQFNNNLQISFFLEQMGNLLT